MNVYLNVYCIVKRDCIFCRMGWKRKLLWQNSFQYGCFLEFGFKNTEEKERSMIMCCAFL